MWTAPAEENAPEGTICAEPVTAFSAEGIAVIFGFTTAAVFPLSDIRLRSPKTRFSTYIFRVHLSSPAFKTALQERISLYGHSATAKVLKKSFPSAKAKT